MDAVRALLVAALAQPHNSQFVLLSESEVPLYPAAVVWRQLQGETKSRINACKGVCAAACPCRSPCTLPRCPPPGTQSD